MKRESVIFLVLNAVLIFALALAISPSSAALNTPTTSTAGSDVGGAVFRELPVSGSSLNTYGASGDNDHSYNFGLRPQADYDWGDLPDSFATLSASTGPSHVITNALYLGSCVDGETDGQPDIYAGTVSSGDDGNAGNPVAGTCANGDDEDGITMQAPLFVVATPPCIHVTAHNATGAAANLYGWIDFNGDGSFDSSEALTGGAGGVGNFSGGKAIVPAGGVTNGSYCFAVPTSATFEGGTYMRFRLTTDTLDDSDAPWGGAATDGEVEDYRMAFDWGDLPESYDDGQDPSHIISPDLYLGSCVDGETHEQRSAGATDDDNTAGLPVAGTCVNDDDEDGVALTTPLISGEQACFDVTAHNAKASAATIYAWIDWNVNESFGEFFMPDPDEAFTLGVIPAQTDWTGHQLCTTVPTLYTPVTYKDTTVCMRFRLATALEEPRLEGLANDGEVEDYCQEFGPTAVTMRGMKAGTGVSIWLLGIAGLALVTGGALLRHAATLNIKGKS